MKKPASETLRYQHMVARLEGLPAYKKGAVLMQEIARGRQWRMDAAIDAIEKTPRDWNYISQTAVMEACGTYGRLQTLQRIARRFECEKEASKFGATGHGVLEAFDEAVLHGHYKVADYLAQKCAASPDYLKNNQRPQVAMSWAIEENDLRKVKYLLDLGANPSYHMIKAVSKGNVGLVDLFLSRGADVNYASEGHWTPLLIAVKYRQHDVIDALLARGASAEKSSADILHEAQYIGAAMVEKMIKAGAAPNERALSGAVYDGKLDIAGLYARHGVAPGPDTLAAALRAPKDSDAKVQWCLDNGLDLDRAAARAKADAVSAYGYDKAQKEEYAAKVEAIAARKSKKPQGPKL